MKHFIVVAFIMLFCFAVLPEFFVTDKSESVGTPENTRQIDLSKDKTKPNTDSKLGEEQAEKAGEKSIFLPTKKQKIEEIEQPKSDPQVNEYVIESEENTPPTTSTALANGSAIDNAQTEVEKRSETSTAYNTATKTESNSSTITPKVDSKNNDKCENCEDCKCDNCECDSETTCDSDCTNKTKTTCNTNCNGGVEVNGESEKECNKDCESECVGGNCKSINANKAECEAPNGNAQTVKGEPEEQTSNVTSGSDWLKKKSTSGVVLNQLSAQQPQTDREILPRVGLFQGGNDDKVFNGSLIVQTTNTDKPQRESGENLQKQQPKPKKQTPNKPNQVQSNNHNQDAKQAQSQNGKKSRATNQGGNTQNKQSSMPKTRQAGEKQKDVQSSKNQRNQPQGGKIVTKQTQKQGKGLEEGGKVKKDHRKNQEEQVSKNALPIEDKMINDHKKERANKEVAGAKNNINNATARDLNNERVVYDVELLGIIDNATVILQDGIVNVKVGA